MSHSGQQILPQTPSGACCLSPQLIAVRAGIYAKMIAHRDRFEELAVELTTLNIEIDEAKGEAHT